MKRRLLMFRAVLVIGGCLAGLVLAETGLRLIGFGLGTNSAFQPDPYCGARHVPGYRGWHTQEGRTWVEINQHGFRDRPRTRAKPPDVFRIAVIGDSFSEAFQVELEQTYWALLERTLNEQNAVPGKRVEVLNFGVSGFGTAQELQMLRHYVWDFAPDLVLLQFLASNDVRNNSHVLEPETGRPFFTVEGDRLVYDDSFLRNPQRTRFQTSRWIQFKHFFIEHSRVCALIYQVRHRGERPTTHAEEPGLAMGAFRAPRDDAWREAWEITDHLVLAVAAEAREHSAQFVVVMANTGVEVNPDGTARRELLAHLGVEDLLYPERRLEALGAKHGFAVIRLAEPMRRYAEQHNTYLHGFPNTQLGTGHWNAHGHRVAAEIVAEGIVDSR